MDEFTPLIPDAPPDPVSDNVVSTYLPQYSLANQDLQEEAIKMTAYRLKMGEELLMRQELYLKDLQATAANRKELISNAIDNADVPFAEALLTREIPTIPLGMATEIATAEAGAAIKMSESPEFPMNEQDVKYNALALSLNNAFVDVFDKLPKFAGDNDTDKVIKNAKAVGLWTAYLGELMIPLWYSYKTSEEGDRLKGLIAPGTVSKENATEIWEKFQSTDLNEVNSAVQEWKANLEKKFPNNPVALLSAMTEALTTSQSDNADLIRVFSQKDLIVNGQKIPSLLPQVWESDSVLDLEFDSALNDEWMLNSLNLLDIAGVGAGIKAIPKLFMRVAGQKAAARLAATEAVRTAGTGSKAAGYMTSLRANDLDLIPGVQSEVDKMTALADTALADRIIVNRVDALTGQPVEKVLRSFEGEYGKKLISAKFVATPQGDTVVETLVGTRKGTGYASLKAAEKANEKAAGVYEIVDGKTLGLDGYFLKANRSVDEAGWLRGEDAVELVKGNEVKAGWFMGMWKRGSVGNESDFGRYFWSPAVTAIHRATREAVSSSFEKAKMGAVVENILTPMEKLSSKQKKVLGEVIQHGKMQPSRLKPNETGRWFDYGELDRLYMTKYGRNVTQEEAVAYYSYKTVSDLAHVLGNEVERSKMFSAGAETWQLKNHAFSTIIGKKVGTDIAEDFPILLPDGRVVIRGELSADDLKNFDIIEAYGQAEHNGTRFGHILVDKKTSFTGGLQRNVLGYTEGGTRNYADVWFGKQKATSLINGKKVARNPLTHGIFRTKQDGMKYAQTMNAAIEVYKSYLSDVTRIERGALKKRDRLTVTATTETRLQEIDPDLSIEKIQDMVDNGQLDLNNPIEIVYDREMLDGFDAPNWERLKTYQRGGKMYYSERGQHLLQDGEPAPLVDPYVALSNQIGSMIHSNAYRNFAIREVGEWGASFGKYYEVPGVAFPSSDEKLKYGIWKGSNNPEMNKLRNISESQRMYVKRILLQPGQSDIFIAQAKSRLAQKLAISLGDKNVPESFRTGKIVTEASAVRGLRTLAYEMALGFFNVGQLAVQGSAAITATIIHPIHGVGAMKDYGLIRAVAAADYNPAMIAVMDKRLAKSKFFGFKAGEFTKLVDDYRRSGMHLVGRTDATLDRAGAVSEGSASTAWQNIREKLRMPLYEGERIGRITSFGIARREAQEAVAAGKFAEGSGDYFQFIQKNANKYTLNMMSGMETWWQRNAFAQLPLQFFQYPFKYMEVFLGMNKEFTEAERWRFIIGHMMLYGAYGVPLGPEAAKGAALPGFEAVNGRKPTEDEYEGIMLGLMDTAIAKMTGSETAAASTFGSGGFIGEFVKDLYGDNSPIGLSGGIALNSITKIGDVFADAGKLFYAVAFNESLHNASPELISEATVLTMTELGNVIRSMSNANKAYYLYKYGQLRDNRGGVIESDSGYNAFVTAMGIRSKLEWKKWDAIESSKSKKERLQEIANKISKLQQEGETFRRNGEIAEAEGKMKVAAALYMGIEDFRDQQEVIGLVNFYKKSDVETYLYKNKDALRYEQTGE